METAASESRTQTRIIGGVGTGKTQRLIDHVCDLLDNDVDPQCILVMVSAPQAVHDFERRLEAAATARSLDFADVVVATPRSISLGILSSDEAIAWSGRKPRLLAGYEELFLFEDMKVSGLHPKRLREMLKFFYRSWTELADDQSDWLIPGEEADAHALLKANLAAVQSILEPELANLAVNFLRTHRASRSAQVFGHVLVDDYQTLSRASQHLADLMYARSITIAGDPAACAPVFDSYPYAAGLEEFAQRHPNATTASLEESHVCEAAVSAANRLLEDKSMPATSLKAAPDAAPGTARILENPDPESEFRAIADEVAGDIEAGTSPRRIVVASPNAVWSRALARELRAHGVPADILPAKQPVRGDIRDNARCVPARVLTALELVADPENALAWRCWCGFDDYLANSTAFASLRTAAERQGVGVVAALRAMDEQTRSADAQGSHAIAGVVGAERILAAFRAGCDLIAQVGELRGNALLDEITRIVTKGERTSTPSIIDVLCRADEIADAEAPAESTATRTSETLGATPTHKAGDPLADSHAAKAPSERSARELAAAARMDLLFPYVPNSRTSVIVAPYDLAPSFSPDVLVVAGFVSGFIPCRDFFDASAMPIDKQAKEHAKNIRRVYRLVGSPRKKLVVSRFANADLETASALELKIDRIRLVGGERICRIPASPFLKDLAG